MNSEYRAGWRTAYSNIALSNQNGRDASHTPEGYILYDPSMTEDFLKGYTDAEAKWINDLDRIHANG